MRPYSNIIRKVLQVLDGLPPETAPAAILAATQLSASLVSLPWILDLLVGMFVGWYLKRLFEVHVWPELPPEHQGFLLKMREIILFKPPNQEKYNIRIEPTPRKDRPTSRRWDVAILVLVLLAGCAAGAAAALLITQPPGNDSAEAGFARDMMVHHAQAVQMAEIVRDKTQSDDMRILASDIALTQQAQIGIMQGELQAWGLPITGTEPAMGWMGHPTSGPMPGMATPEEIDRLSEAAPEEADVLFLRLMIAHHQAAIPMAEAILKRSDRPEVEQLARAIDASQRAEIENMKSMLEKEVGDSAQVDLEPANGSGTTGSTTLSRSDDGVKVVLEVSELPDRGTMYLAHIHPGTCGEAEEEEDHGHGGHEHEASEEIEYPLSPVEPDAQGNGSSTTVVHNVTLEGLLSGDPKHVNVHAPGSGEPSPVTCANLNEAV